MCRNFFFSKRFSNLGYFSLLFERSVVVIDRRLDFWEEGEGGLFLDREILVIVSLNFFPSSRKKFGENRIFYSMYNEDFKC